MHKTFFASLFGPGFDSFSEAQAWIEQLKSGDVTEFVPTHGKIAGYHVEKEDGSIPIQGFDPSIKPDSAVKILFLNSCGNISIATNETGTKYYPHINANVEYEVA